MKTYKRISPKIGHVSNFKAIDDKDAAKQMKEWNDYQGPKLNERVEHFHTLWEIEREECAEIMEEANKLREALIRVSNCNDLSTAIEYAKEAIKSKL